jgi:hypothetical protein
MEENRLSKEELTQLFESLGIRTSYLEDVHSKENDMTWDRFCENRRLCGDKWGTHKYYSGVQRRDSWSDWGTYWVEDHPLVQYIHTTHSGWRNNDGTHGGRHYVEVYYKTGE